MTDIKLSNRFWSKVNITTGCWEWTAAKDLHGYGRFQHNGKNRKAPRICWELMYGPTEKQILHRCDNPACVNPNHLFVGNHADNMRDRSLKERQPNVRLTTAQVREIKKTKGQPRQPVADKYGITVRAVSAIRGGERWGHVK